MKRIVLVLMFAVAVVFNVQAQKDVEEKEDVFEVVDQMPEYPGGQDSMLSFIVKNVEYPATARQNEIAGKVFVGFVIDETGSVTNAKIIRGVDYDLDKEALRVVNLMEKWTPGKEKGKTVKVKYTLPINFALK